MAVLSFKEDRSFGPDGFTIMCFFHHFSLSFNWIFIFFSTSTSSSQCLPLQDQLCHFDTHFQKRGSEDSGLISDLSILSIIVLRFLLRSLRTLSNTSRRISLTRLRLLTLKIYPSLIISCVNKILHHSGKYNIQEIICRLDIFKTYERIHSNCLLDDICKLDFLKAYNRIHSNYLLDVRTYQQFFGKLV